MQNKNIRAFPADPIKEAIFNSKFPSVAPAARADVTPEIIAEMCDDEKPRFPPLERLPCANFEPEKYRTCPKPGTMACGACKLVSYCSKECQNAHWRSHRSDCKNKLMTDWQPSFKFDKSRPWNVSSEPSYIREQKEPLSQGAAFWGNIPAVDVLNSSENKEDAARDLSLAFVASGDLRHVLRTINSLPEDYSGNINLVINDICPATVCRNFLLILILGSIPDRVLAADIALHFWYSVFMPGEYCLRLSGALVAFLQRTSENEGVLSSTIGPNSTISFDPPSKWKKYFDHYMSDSISMDQAQDEYDRVRTAPSRHDFRERMYSKLRPPHRAAFQQFRRFGIVLPFGAPNAHFNSPNASLFSFDGKWLQTDYADPLHGWDVDTVVRKGKAHGARAEDIYGCLYFYLSDELRLFAERIQRFHISFNVLSFDARVLAEIILGDEMATDGIPASIRFDRIEVSNILDHNYIGIEGVLTAWAPLLRRDRGSAIIGYFMNWVALQPDGFMINLNKDELHRCLGQQRKLRENVTTRVPSAVRENDLSLADDLQVFYDNSQAFRAFLNKQGLDNILKKTNLLRKQEHTIVPHRLYAPLRGPDSALPEFADDESWYYKTRLHSSTWTERFVEFTVDKVV